jgi:hypothetical protein
LQGGQVGTLKKLSLSPGDEHVLFFRMTRRQGRKSVRFSKSISRSVTQREAGCWEGRATVWSSTERQDRQESRLVRV